MPWFTMSAPSPFHASDASRPLATRISASIVLVPTPSVLATRSGSSMATSSEAENTPPKLPRPAITRSSCVLLTAADIRAVVAAPAARDTPAAAYAWFSMVDTEDVSVPVDVVG